MKSQRLQSLLLAAAATITTATAQTYNQTGPFTLQIASGSADAALDGAYLLACHAGAAIEGLCVGGTSAPPDAEEYYLNYTGYTTTAAGDEVGLLVWNLPVSVGTGNGTSQTELVSSPMDLAYGAGTNVAVPLFEPAEGSSTQVGFDAAGTLFAYASDADAAFTPAGPPAGGFTSAPLYHWHVCYAYVGGYYYQALAWVTAGAPHNPTCVAVNVTRGMV